MTARDRILSLGVALLLHVLAAAVAVLLRVSDPAVRRDSVELRFRLERPPERIVTQTPVPRTRSVDRFRPPAPSPSRSGNPPPVALDRGKGTRETEEAIMIPRAVVSPDSSRARRIMDIRSVFDRPVNAEKAWEVLGELLEEYPQFRESVMREMIAGAGLPPDSLPRADMRYEQMFRDGIRPSWERQRETVEHAFRSFDPVHGWMNKGGYGPAVNVLGLLKFLIDLIEGDD